MTEARVPDGDPGGVPGGDAPTRAHRRRGDHPAPEQATDRRTPDRKGRERPGDRDDAATRRHPRRPAASAAPPPSAARPAPPALARRPSPPPGPALTGRRRDAGARPGEAAAPSAVPRTPRPPDPRRATVWIRDEREAADPVFVDASGRRRLVWRAVGVALALVCLALVALVVLAAVSGTPTPLTSGAAPFPLTSSAEGTR